MIHVNEKAKEKIDYLDLERLYVVADFDKTITHNDSDSSWGILERSNLINEEYTKKSLEMYEYYHPIEFDFDMDTELKDKLMYKWWTLNIELFVKYELKEEVVKNATQNMNEMKFREGGKEFLKKMHEKNIPVIIISAGIGNFIEQFLKQQDSFFPNIHILSNFISFENGIATGVCETIIHSQNKNIVALTEEIKAKLDNRDKVLLLGDNLADIKMVPEEQRENTIRIGFLNFNETENLEKFKTHFDIVCTEETNFHDLEKILKREYSN